MMPETKQPTDAELADKIRPRIVAVLFATVLLATVATYFGAHRLFESQAVSVAHSQHALYVRSLNEAIRQHQHLPYLLAENPLLAERVARGEAHSLNTKLKSFADASGLEAIYIMALNGDVIATSNFDSADSFLGQNYGFRPYFRRAMENVDSGYFAIGATTGRPGYFVASLLKSTTGDPVGVVAIKIDFSELQASWEERGEKVLATNSDGIVVLTSDAEWLYQTIEDLGETRRHDISESLQFASEPLQPLDWDVLTDEKVALEGQVYLRTVDSADLVSWTVHYLTPVANVHRQTLIATGLLGSLIAVLIGFAAFLRSRRIAAALAISQRQRKELVQANESLVRAQEELSRTSKLAALGQLAASVTHELGQPISALKNHLAAAELGNEITSPETSENLKRLAARMEGITSQLRFFARKAPEERRLVDMVDVVREATSLLQHDLDAAGVKIEWAPPDKPCTVIGIQLRLEQALVNLLRNALHATAAAEHDSIVVSFGGEGENIEINVTDKGPGLNGVSLEELQEPFFSTKSSGDGMGLGLAIASEIIRAHDGVLTAYDSPTGGAVFTLSLPFHSEVNH